MRRLVWWRALRPDMYRLPAVVLAIVFLLTCVGTVLSVTVAQPVAADDTPGWALAATSSLTPTASETSAPTETAAPSGTPTPTETPTPGGPSTAATVYQCDSSTDPANVPDAYEPGDNTLGGATLLQVGSSQTHNLCSAISAPDTDWYYFDAVTTQEYTVETANLGITVDTYMVVEGPSGFLAQDDDNGPGVGSQVKFTPATAGRYYVQISQASKRPFTAEDSDLPRTYTILLSATTAPTRTPTTTPAPATATPTGTPSPCRDRYEFDNNVDAANGLYVRKSQSHILCGDGDVDWVWVDLVAGKPYRISTSGLADGVDTLIVLYDSDAETVLQVNDDYPGIGLASRVDIVPETTKRYYLKVQDTVGHGADNFSYTLTLDTDGLPLAGPCLDKYEPDGMPDGAAEILLRETQNHGFCPEGDADWVRFFAQAGKSYTVQTGNLTIGTDTTITIFGPSVNGVIAADDDGGGDLASRVDFVAPVSGIYYAQIKNLGDIGGKGQAYSVSLTTGGVAVVSTPTALPTSQVTVTRTATVRSTVTASQAMASQLLTADVTPVIVTSTSEFVDESFAATWLRTDAPVREQRVERSWYWGAQAGPAYREPYKGAPGQERLVQYFDKARMEITNPVGDRTSPWFVTNGLLVREMISGLLQRGDATSDQRRPAEIPIVGDGDSLAPTYASLRAVASLDNDRRVPNRVGAPVVEMIARSGKIGDVSQVPASVVNTVYIDASGHNIPDVFWRYMTQEGLVATDQGYQSAVLSDWLYAFGLPITEAYWTRAVVGGVEKDVLVQAFERRVLTYTPDNPEGWQVEMGNVGQHYQRWRYGG